MTDPEAYVTEVDGKLVLVDPIACAVIESITTKISAETPSNSKWIESSISLEELRN